MLQESTYSALNLTKANFDTVYELADPREYFRVLCGLDYVIPELARDIFRTMIGHCAPRSGAQVRVLDIGCSYGINAALVRYPLDLQRLRARYTHPLMQGVPAEELASLDRHYFRSWPAVVGASFIGLDRSPAAIAYATRVGLLAQGLHSDLEREEPSATDIAILRDVDLIISTGCVGYVTEQTFRRILLCQWGRQMPWVANFVLRMFPYASIAEQLQRFGLVTEKLDGVTFVQRRFHSQREMESTLDALSANGIDPNGKETDGLLHAELYVSRPADVAAELPLNQIVSVTSGGNRPYGRRYRTSGQGLVKLI